MEINRNKKINVKEIEEKTSDKQLSRKEALKKAGRYAAFTAAATMTMLSPLSAQSPNSTGNGYGGSPSQPGDNGNDPKPSGDWVP